jgi:hypothetical protein
MRGRRFVFSPMRSLLIFVFFALAAACGSSSPSGDGGVGDMASMSGGACSIRTDCRLFSSYCVTAPCQCLALPRNAVDPPCVAGTQSCLVDPCLNKSADCVGGMCAVTP